MERSLVMLKPDAVKRNLVDDIMKYFENEGLNITQKKELTATREIAGNHYADSMPWYKSCGSKTIESYKRSGLNITDIFSEEDPVVVGKQIRDWLMDFISSGSVLAMIIEGPEGTIQKIRDLAGNTNPPEANEGTIRGDLGIDSYEKANKEGRALENLVHASESAEEAEREIAIWFPKLA
ncbi:MAG: nucleoside-diphosphate kinase [Patescibacteria group bacterium]|nr:nucleoside-diphosphate kinase [Patescibacteria group bacterium]